MTTQVRRAHAKINLSLAITGTLSNGYHTLQSVMAPLDLHDTMTFEFDETPTTGFPTIETQTSFEGPSRGAATNLSSEDNICTKAARALFDHPQVRQSGRPLPRRLLISIEKRIPMGGGMGGGSSNAAATLLALADSLNLEADSGLIQEVAVKLGADVPFLLQSQPCLCEGIGEVLSPLPWAEEWSQKHVYLFCPDFGVSTPWAYQEWDLQKDSLNLIRNSIRFDSLDHIFTAGFNDFESIVFGENPLLTRILSEMKTTGALYSRMSGSGSTLFAVCNSAQETARIEESIGNLLTREFKNSGWYSIRTTGMRKEALGLHPWKQHEHHRNQNFPSH